uniref:Uncharacterized protein n=1 Tax=viral metagenome TaxID=1070528 RepID=A0A6C0HEW4_9ZZZZ
MDIQIVYIVIIILLIIFCIGLYYKILALKNKKPILVNTNITFTSVTSPIEVNFLAMLDENDNILNNVNDNDGPIKILFNGTLLFKNNIKINLVTKGIPKKLVLLGNMDATISISNNFTTINDSVKILPGEWKTINL